MELTLFSIQNTPITIASIVMFILFLVIFSVAGRIISRLIFNRVLAKVDMDSGIRYTLTRFTNYTIVFIGVIISFQFLGIDLSGLAVIFGLLSVGIGFGLQNVTSNFIAGLILLIERPIKIGDRIIVTDQEGDVIEINMRSTTIRSLENISIIVPNADFISGRVINFSHNDTRIKVRVEVGVSYSSDLDLVIQTLKDAANQHPNILKDVEPIVILKNFGESSWDMVVVVWIDDPQMHVLVASDIRMNIVRLFKEREIEIPFPQRDINFRNVLPYTNESKEAEQ
ncbi:MAG TPA: mechanosensitive ion channel protein MscS [Bacteroidetes bacterium]|nr:mechanosensitive ion channel protein MscS [Bacteroidota bacterium]